MIRFVLAPSGTGGGAPTLTPDLANRLPGRGMWLSAKADVLERALSRGAFTKAARGPVRVPADLREAIEDGLRRRLRDLVGFARRAGQAVTGFHAVREWITTGRVAVLVEASDGSPAERARLAGGSDATVVAALTAAELGGVFGRDHAVHVAVAPGRLAKAIGVEAARLRGLAAKPGSAGEGTMPAPRRDGNGNRPRGHAQDADGQGSR